MKTGVTDINSISWLGILSKISGEYCIGEETFEMRRDIKKVLGTITWQEAMVITLRSCGFTLRACGECFGVQKERVRQIEAKGYRKLRHPTRYRQIERYIHTA